MKLTLIFILLFAISLSALQLDKVCHFTGSYIIYDVTYNVLNESTYMMDFECEWIALSTALSIGIGKEVYDEYNGGIFSSEDMFYNISGTVTALIFNRWYVKIRRNAMSFGIKF